MIEKIFILLLCHLIGDYVLQSDFIAKTKGSNWWHLIAHCFLYVLPFYVCFGWCWQLKVIFGAHLITDALKARWNKITYLDDQIIHLVMMMLYLV